MTAAVNFLCFLVDAVLELWTFVGYQRMDFVGKKKHNENYRLLGKGMFVKGKRNLFYSVGVTWYDHEHMPRRVLWNDRSPHPLQ